MSGDRATRHDRERCEHLRANPDHSHSCAQIRLVGRAIEESRFSSLRRRGRPTRPALESAERDRAGELVLSLASRTATRAVRRPHASTPRDDLRLHGIAQGPPYCPGMHLRAWSGVAIARMLERLPICASIRPAQRGARLVFPTAELRCSVTRLGFETAPPWLERHAHRRLGGGNIGCPTARRLAAAAEVIEIVAVAGAAPTSSARTRSTRRRRRRRPRAGGRGL